MVQYYYDKYTAIGTPIYSWQTGWGSESVYGATFASGFTSYVIQSDGSFTLTGTQTNIGTGVAGTVYFNSGGTLAKNTTRPPEHTVITIAYATKQKVQTGTNYSRGTLQQSNVPAEDGTYPVDGRHTDGYWYVRKTALPINNKPTVSISSPNNDQTLYENDTINIAGTANDTDKDQSVTAYYQINSEPKKVLATNLSQTQIPLSKQLTFKAGKLYDGETVITGDLADGVAHTLKVWAEDSEKASSTIIERAFYVVPNRAPLLSVDAVAPSGVVDTDKFTISGNASDQDANANVTVTQRINGGNSVEIYNGPGGAWGFDVFLAQLTVGQNTIIIEVIDNYGAKSSKTIKLNKNEAKTPILQSVARYKIEPPKGSAKGVLLWIQRDEDLADLKVKLSMNLQGEQESYTTLTATNTAPVDSEIVEDEFYFEADEAKNNIILKLSTSRADINIDHKIHLISGVLE